MRRKLVAANWKMHGSSALTATLLGALVAEPPPCEVVVFPPFPYLPQAVQLAFGAVGVGTQDLSAHAQGAYTGEVSAAMLHEVGARWVLVGHSERRQYHHESDVLIAAKLQRALENGLTPVLCVGETLDEHERGNTERVIASQLQTPLQVLGGGLAGVVIAYEPIWAIGTGENCDMAEANRVMGIIRESVAALADVPILYGGSMKADNVAAYMEQTHINGGLVGGASLDPDGFATLIRNAALRQAQDDK